MGLAIITNAASQEIFAHLHVTTILLLHMKLKLFIVITMATRYRENETRNVRTNVTVKCVRATTVAVEQQ